MTPLTSVTDKSVSDLHLYFLIILHAPLTSAFII